MFLAHESKALQQMFFFGGGQWKGQGLCAKNEIKLN